MKPVVSFDWNSESICSFWLPKYLKRKQADNVDNSRKKNVKRTDLNLLFQESIQIENTKILKPVNLTRTKYELQNGESENDSTVINKEGAKIYVHYVRSSIPLLQISQVEVHNHIQNIFYNETKIKRNNRRNSLQKFGNCRISMVKSESIIAPVTCSQLQYFIDFIGFHSIKFLTTSSHQKRRAQNPNDKRTEKGMSR